MENLITENLKAHFLRLYQMALADDHFSELELKMLYNFAEERNIPSEELDKILLSPSNSKVTVPDNMEEKIGYIYDLTEMIWADEEVSPNERSALEKYIVLFGFLPENAEALADYFLESVKNGKTAHEIINEITE